MDHSFNVVVAEKVGLTSAVIFNSLYYWIEKNKADERNYNDGYYWTFMSRKGYCKYFPYLTERQIEYSLRKLVDEGYLVTGNYNKSAYDRTLWYRITDRGYAILQNCEIEKQILKNENNKNVKPIPDINKDINKDTDNVEQSPTIPYLDIINYLNEKADTNFRGASKDNQKHITARWNEGFRLEDFYSVIDVKVSEWKNDKKMSIYLRPSTLFGTKFEGYLQQAVKSEKHTKATAISKQWSGETAKDDQGKEIIY